MNNLTERQSKVFKYIKEFIEDKKYPPSVREICRGVGIKSTSTAYNDLKKLESLGFIKTNSSKSRSIEIIKNKKHDENDQFIRVPVLGAVAAGLPILAEENIEEIILLPYNYKNKGNLFILNVTGDSMIDKGIFDGDKLLVRQQNSADNGDVVVALIDDSATVKTLYIHKDKIELRPENSTMESLFPDNVIILGKVISLFRNQI